MAGEIRTASMRLNRLVENLLDMTRIESGGLNVLMDWCDIRDLINGVTADLRDELSEHTVVALFAEEPAAGQTGWSYRSAGHFEHCAQCRAIYAFGNENHHQDGF